MRRAVDSPELVVSSKDEHPHAPLLAFQHAPGYLPPRWPTACGCRGGSMGTLPAAAATSVAVRLGAVRASDDHIYADPAGHPFCILAVGE